MSSSSLTALAITACLLSGGNAFTVPSFAQRTQTRMLMSSDDEKPVQLTSGRKEIAYDETTGRFFETNNEECNPVDEYCAIDESTGKTIALTVEEKERIFLDALQSYYATGRQVLSDEDFDLLKEDLQWNGSSIAVLNRKEAKYLTAMQAYLKGEPVMSDAEFDTLKAELKEDGSQFAVSTEPKCYIDTGICTVTLKEDKFRTNLLYLPAGAVLATVWLAFSFEFFNLLSFPINPLILLGLGAVPIYNFSIALTEGFVFENNKIAYGPCPSCEHENRVYFGNILGVEGYSDVADVKCSKCKIKFKVQRKTLRASTVPKA